MAKKSGRSQSEVLNRARTRVSQTDVPAHSLTQAIRVPQTIADNFALQGTKPLLVAQGMNSQPTSGTFRMLCGASIAYGLTQGGYNAPAITLTDIGRRV